MVDAPRDHRILSARQERPCDRLPGPRRAGGRLTCVLTTAALDSTGAAKPLVALLRLAWLRKDLRLKACWLSQGRAWLVWFGKSMGAQLGRSAGHEIQSHARNLGFGHRT